METEQMMLKDPAITEVPAPKDPEPEAPKRGRGRPPGSGKKSAPAPAAGKSNDRAPSSAGPGRPSNRTRRTEALARYYNMIGGACILFAPEVGKAIIDQADEAAASIAQWADTNSRVAKFVDSITDLGAGSGVFLAHLPIIMALYRTMTGQAQQASPLDLVGSMMSGFGINLNDLNIPEA